jgi:hypothetical protein
LQRNLAAMSISNLITTITHMVETRSGKAWMPGARNRAY